MSHLQTVSIEVSTSKLLIVASRSKIRMGWYTYNGLVQVCRALTSDEDKLSADFRQTQGDWDEARQTELALSRFLGGLNFHIIRIRDRRLPGDALCVLDSIVCTFQRHMNAMACCRFKPSEEALNLVINRLLRLPRPPTWDMLGGFVITAYKYLERLMENTQIVRGAGWYWLRSLRDKRQEAGRQILVIRRTCKRCYLFLDG